MRKFLASAFFLSVPAFATVITTSGEGHIGANPDYIHVVVDVKSQCYDTSASASAANTKLATEISKSMSNTINANNKKDEVLVNQGATSKYSVTEYDQATNKQKTVCTGWGAASSVELKLADLKAWPALQDSLTQLIDAAGANAPEKSTVAAISSVSPRLYPETQSRISKEAIAQALEDARAKAEIALKAYKMCFSSYRSVNPDSGGAGPRPYADGAARAAFAAPGGGGGGRGVELAFGPQYAHASATIEIEAVICPN